MSQNIKKASLYKFCQKTGIDRVSALCYEELRGIIIKFLEQFLSTIVTRTEYYRKKTITVNEVIPSMSPKIYVPTNDVHSCKKKTMDICFIFQRRPIEKLVREIISNYKTDIRVQKEAFIFIQYYLESFILRLLMSSKVYMVSGKRNTLYPKDIILAWRDHM